MNRFLSAMALLMFLASPAQAADEDLRWGELRVESEIPLAELGWNAEAELRGRSVSQRELDASLDDLLRRLADAGYPFARVILSGFDLVDGAVTGVIEVDPGVQPVLAGIELEGARVTRPATALRMAGLRSGQPYRGLDAENVRTRLLRSGLFTSVESVQLLPGDEREKVVLRARVTEPATTRFTGILGVSGPDSKLTGLVDLALTNVAGTAREAAGSWENRGDGLTRFYLRYREPWLPYVPIGVTGSLRHDINEGVYSFTEYEVSGDLSLRSLRFEAGLGGARAVETLESVPNSSEDFVVAGIVWDRRNNLRLPTSGLRLSLRSRRGTKDIDAVGNEAARSFDRTRWNLGGEGYARLSRRWLAVMQTRFQYLDTDEETVPRYDLFSVGGALTLRGYREEQFLTTASVVMQSEVRFLQDRLGSALYGFFDAGALSSDPSRGTRDDFDRFVFGYGVGVRQGSRLGVLGVEYGIPRGSGPLDGRIHLRLDAVF